MLFIDSLRDLVSRRIRAKRWLKRHIASVKLVENPEFRTQLQKKAAGTTVYPMARYLEEPE